MEKAKVSVIVPVYNVEQYLSKCLDTLVNQTLENIEIIVVNDGSPDNSQEIIDDYVKRFPGKVYSYIKENGGLSDARNYGVAKATGEYLAFVDSDDFVREDMFQLLYNKAIEEDSDIVVCNYNRFESDCIFNTRIIKHIDYFNNCVEEKPKLLLECKSYAWNKLYRRTWYINNNFTFPCGQWFEDSAVVYNMLYLANKISAIEDYLYFYRIDRKDSITNTINNKIFDVFKSCESIKVFYMSHTDNKKVLEVADRLCQIHIFVRLNELIVSGPLKLKYSYYNATMNFFNTYMPKWTKNKYYKKVKKKTLYLKYRHKPFFMYIYFLIPQKILAFLQKPTKKDKINYYINKDRLRELQLIELDILKEVDRICRRNSLTYYLGEGTLLGAVRHKGFIPWDDDLDIVMPRKDYECLLNIINEELSDSYLCLNEKTVSTYYLPFTKIVSAQKHGFENRLDVFPEEYRGPFIDIFPLDYFNTANENAINKKHLKIRKIRDELLLKANYIVPKTFKRKWYNILSKFHTNESLFTRLYDEMTQFDDTNNYQCNFASSYHPSRQVVAKEVYGEPKYVPFEDGLFPVPNDAHVLLTSIYGNYMKMPPVKKRKSKHSFYDEISMTTQNITKPLEEKEMNDLILDEVRELQKIELDILKEVDRVCKENDITYYLGEGTLLGAIRHNGFIPWDDDIDIVMPRKDLEKFMSICDEKLKPNYKFQWYHNINNYWVQSPKVRLLDKTNFTQSKLKKYTDDVGPYIDIFPLDYAPDSVAKLKRQDKYIKKYRRILFIKTGFSTPKNMKQRFYKLYSYFISAEKIHEKINRKATKYNDDGDRKYICNFGSYYNITKEVFPVYTFDNPEYIKFEDSEFPVPCNSKYVLATTYGNYMSLPPESKRIAKHSFD